MILLANFSISEICHCLVWIAAKLADRSPVLVPALFSQETSLHSLLFLSPLSSERHILWKMLVWDADKSSLTCADNTILLQLGSTYEGQTPEEKGRYISGLKKIIAGMRDRNLKDISAVASEIVAYRTQFLGDRSRILTDL